MERMMEFIFGKAEVSTDTGPPQPEIPTKESEIFKRTNRTVTDGLFLVLLIFVVLSVLGFVGYCIAFGDIYRVINGYDDCGNVCGHEMQSHPEINDSVCTVNQTNQTTPPYQILLRIESTGGERKCVSDCSEYQGYRQLLYRCIPVKNYTIVNNLLERVGVRHFFQDVSDDFHLFWRPFVYSCVSSLGFSILILILFRFLVGIIVWLLLTLTVVASIGGTAFSWYMWYEIDESLQGTPENNISNVDNRKWQTYLAVAVIATVVTLMIILIILVMRKRIKLVVQLFKEAGKAVGRMPLLLFQPFLTFIALTVILGLFIYFCLWIEGAGFLKQKSEHVYYYEKDFLMKWTRWHNVFCLFWMSMFVIGCQHMILAGAVAQWYFTRNKENLKNPISRSYGNLIKYHLGTVAVGSFLIAVVQLLRLIFKVAETSMRAQRGKCLEYLFKCCQCCLFIIERIMTFISRNAYIETAIHGHSFFKGGQRAFNLLLANLLRVAAINSVGDFVILLGKVFVVALTVLTGFALLKDEEGLEHMWVLLTLAGVFAFFIGHCFMSVYEMAIDTIFLCFCEDCDHNDGVKKPYYMSRDLMEFVENSKKAIQAYDKRQAKVENRNEKPPVESSTDRKKK